MEDESRRVLETLEASEYDWMTVASIAQKTRLSEQQVKPILEAFAFGNVVIKKPDPERDGSPIYAARSRYRRPANLLNRTLSALADRVK